MVFSSTIQSIFDTFANAVAGFAFFASFGARKRRCDSIEPPTERKRQRVEQDSLLDLQNIELAPLELDDNDILGDLDLESSPTSDAAHPLSLLPHVDIADPGPGELPTVIPKISSSRDHFWATSLVPSVLCLVVDDEDSNTYYLVPRSSNGAQVYTAKHLQFRHAVVQLKAFVADKFLSVNDQRRVIWYSQDEDHEDDFFVILNKEDSFAHAIGDDFPFGEVLQYTIDNATVETNHPATRQRQYLNRGYTGTQGMGMHDDQGIPTPVLKPGTHDPPVINAMVCASNYFSSLCPPWNSNTPFVIPPIRERRFGNEIAPGCKFEGSTFTTSPLCAWHRDAQNPPPDEQNVSSVTTVSKEFPDRQLLTSVFYFRLSVSVNIQLNNDMDPMVKHFLQTYNAFPPERRDFGLDSIGVGTGFLEVKPNLDTIGFHNMWLACYITLINDLRLNLFESASLCVITLLFPNTTKRLTRATISLMLDG